MVLTYLKECCKTPRLRLPTNPTDLHFFLSFMSLVALAYAYYILNKGDKHQNVVLVLAGAGGLVVAMSLDVGILIGIFGVETWFMTLGLVVSDALHTGYMRKLYRGRRKDWEAVSDAKV